MYVCIYTIYIYIYTHIHMYVYVYIYIHIIIMIIIIIIISTRMHEAAKRRAAEADGTTMLRRAVELGDFPHCRGEAFPFRSSWA